MKKYIIRFSIFILLLIIVKKLSFPYFINRQNERTLAEIKRVNPTYHTIFSTFIADIEKETGWRVMVTSGYRNHEEQAVLHQRDSRNADAGKSKHNFGKAIDLTLYQNGWLSMTWRVKASAKNRWEKTGVLAVAQKHKLKWGGYFKNYYDPVHFEIE